jgi:hypothetical protein
LNAETLDKGVIVMPDKNGDIYLYEALELRAEYQARIASLKALLPERQQSERGFLRREDNERREPADGFDPGNTRERIRKLEYKGRKLNAAVQKVNLANEIDVGGDTMSLAEALELRKGVSQELAELQKMLEKAAYRKVIYKEERNIVEEPAESFPEVSRRLEERRLLFRRLNRELRKASFTITIPFQDKE